MYTNSQDKVRITCPKHGEFQQTPTAHVHGKQGCYNCYIDNKKGTGGGYSYSYFERKPEMKERSGMLYVVHMECDTDDFIKVGITRNNIKERYRRKGEGNKYLHKEVLATKYMSLFDAYQLEQKILQELKEYKYWPNYVFDGRTECFKNKPEVIQRIQDLMK